jgi:hypothetical protein
MNPKEEVPVPRNVPPKDAYPQSEQGAHVDGLTKVPRLHATRPPLNIMPSWLIDIPPADLELICRPRSALEERQRQDLIRFYVSRRQIISTDWLEPRTRRSLDRLGQAMDMLPTDRTESATVRARGIQVARHFVITNPQPDEVPPRILHDLAMADPNDRDVRQASASADRQQQARREWTRQFEEAVDEVETAAGALRAASDQDAAALRLVEWTALRGDHL